MARRWVLLLGGSDAGQRTIVPQLWIQRGGQAWKEEEKETSAPSAFPRFIINNVGIVHCEPVADAEGRVHSAKVLSTM